MEFARAEVAARGLANRTIEQIVHHALGHTAPAITLRTRLLLRTFFSELPWTSREAGSLAGIIGDGTEWHTIELADDLHVCFGWRAGQFRIDAWCTTGDGSRADAAAPDPAVRRLERHVPTEISHAAVDNAPLDATATHSGPPSLDESFDGPVACETRPGNRVIAFRTGTDDGSGNGAWLRPCDAVTDPRITGLFTAFPLITGILPRPGGFDVELDEHTEWSEMLLPILARFTTEFSPTRVAAAVDRDELRMVEDFEGLDLRTVSAQLRIRNSLTDRRAYVRRLALEVIGRSDPLRAAQFWRSAIDDPAREVRRVAVIGASESRNEELRPMLERALIDSDARVRFHAVRGLWFLGAQRSRTALSRSLFDDDARVRTAAQCVVRGVRPPD